MKTVTIERYPVMHSRCDYIRVLYRREYLSGTTDYLYTGQESVDKIIALALRHSSGVTHARFHNVPGRDQEIRYNLKKGA